MSLQRVGLHDWWSECCFMLNSAVATPFAGVVVGTGGTNNTAVPVNPGYLPDGVLLRCGTTAGSGWRYQASSVSALFFGVQKRKFRAKYSPKTAVLNNTVRLGFLDTVSAVDATDGAYFELLAGVVSAKTSNNSVRTTSGVTLTMTIDVVYTFDIDVNAAGTSARFRIYAGTSETPVYDQTITTNIPTGNVRSFGCGLVATNSGTVAADIGVLYYMGLGSTLPAETLQETVFALNGTTPALNPFSGTIQTWLLTANSAPTDVLADGQSLVLLVDDGTAFAITWPMITWVGGTAPVLKTTGNTIINLFKVGATLYGSF